MFVLDCPWLSPCVAVWIDIVKNPDAPCHWKEDWLLYNEALFDVKLQPTIFPLSKHVIRFHELPAETMLRILQ